MHGNVSEAHTVVSLPCTGLYIQVHDNVLEICMYVHGLHLFIMFVRTCTYMTICLRYVRKLHLYKSIPLCMYVCTYVHILGFTWKDCTYVTHHGKLDLF